jgi:hypothetical protein
MPPPPIPPTKRLSVATPMRGAGPPDGAPPGGPPGLPEPPVPPAPPPPAPSPGATMPEAPCFTFSITPSIV